MLKASALRGLGVSDVAFPLESSQRGYSTDQSVTHTYSKNFCPIGVGRQNIDFSYFNILFYS